MTLVQLYYTAPVVVIVDTDTGKVERVVVIDEEATRTEELPTYDDGATPVGSALATAAIAIGDGEAEWPGWEFGF